MLVSHESCRQKLDMRYHDSIMPSLTTTAKSWAVHGVENLHSQSFLPENEDFEWVVILIAAFPPSLYHQIEENIIEGPEVVLISFTHTYPSLPNLLIWEKSLMHLFLVGFGNKMQIY